MKKMFLVLGFVLIFGALGAPKSHAGEMDILIKKLVEKGILSPVEAQIIVDETKQQVVKEISQGKSSLLPKWVQNVKLKQDLRIRHQYERRNKDTEGRNRGRIRYRLGIQTRIADGLKASVGLATGGSDSRSTNQTLQNAFDTPDMRLDYAYVEYQPLDSLSIAAGKHKRKKYLWAPTDLLWDSDINPEGGAVHFKTSLLDNTDGWINTGVWILDDNDQVDRPDPFMNYVQGGFTIKEGSIDAKLAAIYYGFHGVKGITLSNTAGTNTLTGGVLQHDYDSVGASMEVGVKNLFGGLPFNIDERIAVFSEFIHNVDTLDNGNGWAAGVKFGNKKAKKPGQWQVKYIYANLGKDAFIDAFPDSDRYGGRTDVKSHEVAVKYVWKKNVILGVDYYNSNPIKSSSNPEHIVQTDVQFKF